MLEMMARVSGCFHVSYRKGAALIFRCLAFLNQGLNRGIHLLRSIASELTLSQVTRVLKVVHDFGLEYFLPHACNRLWGEELEWFRHSKVRDWRLLQLNIAHGIRLGRRLEVDVLCGIEIGSHGSCHRRFDE